jgi:biopolymer transport protein ExbD
MANQALVFDEINITPLTDIFLVLLIIMMVVAPMVSPQRPDVVLPQLQAGQTVDPGKTSLEITPTGEFYLEGEPVAEAQLVSALSADLAKRKQAMAEAAAQSPVAPSPSTNEAATTEAPMATLILRADGTVKSGTIINVMQLAKEAGFDKLVVAGKPQAKPTQPAAS